LSRTRLAGRPARRKSRDQGFLVENKASCATARNRDRPGGAPRRVLAVSVLQKNNYSSRCSSPLGSTRSWATCSGRVGPDRIELHRNNEAPRRPGGLPQKERERHAHQGGAPTPRGGEPGLSWPASTCWSTRPYRRERAVGHAPIPERQGRVRAGRAEPLRPHERQMRGKAAQGKVGGPVAGLELRRRLAKSSYELSIGLRARVPADSGRQGWGLGKEDRLQGSSGSSRSSSNPGRTSRRFRRARSVSVVLWLRNAGSRSTHRTPSWKALRHPPDRPPADHAFRPERADPSSSSIATSSRAAPM